jgi:hypothetical protein
VRLNGPAITEVRSLRQTEEREYTALFALLERKSLQAPCSALATMNSGSGQPFQSPLLKPAANPNKMGGLFISLLNLTGMGGGGGGGGGSGGSGDDDGGGFQSDSDVDGSPSPSPSPSLSPSLGDDGDAR